MNRPIAQDISSSRSCARQRSEDGIDELLTRLADGQREQDWIELITRQGALLGAVCRTHLPLEDLVPDAVQETLLNVRKHLSRRRTGSDRAAQGWLCLIAANTARNLYASECARRRRERSWSEDVRDDQGLNRDPANEVVMQALGRLRPAQRRALELRYLEDAEIPAIAAAIGQSEATTRSTIRRALASLRERLKGMSPLLVLLGLASRQASAGDGHHTVSRMPSALSRRSAILIGGGCIAVILVASVATFTRRPAVSSAIPSTSSAGTGSPALEQPHTEPSKDDSMLRTLALASLAAGAALTAADPVVSLKPFFGSNATEGESKSFTISSGPLDKKATEGFYIPVNIEIVGGTATKNRDYTLNRGTLYLMDWSGRGHGWGRIQTKKDGIVEAAETVIIRLKPGAGYQVDSANSTITITIDANRS